jgi:hypothetical protein
VTRIRSAGSNAVSSASASQAAPGYRPIARPLTFGNTCACVHGVQIRTDLTYFVEGCVQISKRLVCVEEGGVHIYTRLYIHVGFAGMRLCVPLWRVQS